MPRARELSLDSFDDAIAEIERLRSSGYTAAGNWNLSQVSEHIAATIRIGRHGGLKPMPWILRATVLRLLFDYVLWRAKMPGGAKAPPEITPADRGADEPAVIEACLDTLRETRDFQGDIARPYPFSTGMTTQKWKRLMLIHAAHHLSHLKPSE